jgi:hypothetical protein
MSVVDLKIKSFNLSAWIQRRFPISFLKNTIKCRYISEITNKQKMQGRAQHRNLKKMSERTRKVENALVIIQHIYYCYYY